MFLTSNAVGKKTSNNNVFNIKKYPENMVIRCLKHGLGLVTDEVCPFFTHFVPQKHKKGRVVKTIALKAANANQLNTTWKYKNANNEPIRDRQ